MKIGLDVSLAAATGRGLFVWNIVLELNDRLSYWPAVMKTFTSKVTKTIIARCDRGEDLYDCLDKLVKENQVRSGCFQVMGALSRAKLGIFQQGRYEWVEHEGVLEIASCIGNVSLKEEKPFVHCHAVLADHKGSSIGGHVGPGCIVDPTAEIHLQVYDHPISRRHGPDTNLWILDI